MYKIINWFGVDCIHVYNLKELDKDMDFVGTKTLTDNNTCWNCGHPGQITIYLYKSKWTGKVWNVCREWYYECPNCGVM
jgi:hypothetical protein